MNLVEAPVATKIVSEADIGARVDLYAFQQFPEFLCSRSRSRKSTKNGFVRVNGEVVESGRVLTLGDRVDVFRPPPLGARKVFPIHIRVLFEDECMALVYKPPGILTNGNRFRTLENALTHNLTPTTASDALAWPRPVHRLDRATQGIVVVAKTQSAEIHLNRQFQLRTVAKTYRAIVGGRLEGGGTVSSAIEGRNAVTRWRSVSVNRSLRTQWMSTVVLYPHTGRTHQLRRHMSLLGHPISGDVLYGVKGATHRGKGLFLCAQAVELAHPKTGERLRMDVEEPEKFASHRARQERRWRKFFGAHHSWLLQGVVDTGMADKS